MSTVKISELPVLSSADAADEFVVVDDSAGVTKKITAAGLNGSLDVAALDDYEEGTWTPRLTVIGGSDFSVGSVSGRYTKVGNLVAVDYNINVTGYSGSAGDVRIVDVPFVINVNASRWSGSNRYNSAFSTLNGIIVPHATELLQAIELNKSSSTTLFSARVHSSNYVGGSSFIQGSLVYQTS